MTRNITPTQTHTHKFRTMLLCALNQSSQNTVVFYLLLGSTIEKGPSERQERKRLETTTAEKLEPAYFSFALTNGICVAEVVK